MAGCENPFSRCTFARSAIFPAVIVLILTITGGLFIPRSAALSAAASNLSNLSFEQNEGTDSAVIGEFEGRYDPSTRRMMIQPASKRSASLGSRILSSLSTPSGDVPQGAGGFSFGVVNSAFVNSGENPATVSGEIQLTNNTNLTLFNTRLVFTAFKIGGSGGTNAGNTPSGNGFAFFNDGQVPYGGKLNVTRFYGDIPAGGNSKTVWTFAVANQPPAFFFSYKVLADIGVSVERVQPSAVQVTAAAGTSVNINGRGFNGTPQVQILPASGSPITMTNIAANATQINATVPAGTPKGVYSVRVTNPGGTPGGAGSSTLFNRLTVTPAPDGAHTLSGNISTINDTGPFLISGNATIDGALTIPAGAVFFISSGANINITASGNITANGGIPGIPGGAGVANPLQIVFTADRPAGSPIPPQGFWGGIKATSASSAEMIMRNVVVEYGGAVGDAEINLTGSGRKLRFADSIASNSAGSGIAAGGTLDSLIGFTRNLIANNGTTENDKAVVLGANASLGLYDLDSSTGGTSVGDPFYLYSSANDFLGNQVNAVQIGKDAEADSNDFTKSGVLVGQGDVPLQLRGSADNPAIVGAVPPSLPAELTVNAGALLQFAPGMDFKAADFPSNRVGAISANGYAGFYLGSQGAMSNKFIDFDKIPGGGNWGAIVFSRNALSSSILNYCRVRNGGAGPSGNSEVIVEGLNMKVTNSQILNSLSGGLSEIFGAIVDLKGTIFDSNNTLFIDTIAGGVLGDGIQAIKANLLTPAAISLDPLGRGIWMADTSGSFSLIRFINTTKNTVTIAGQKIPGGAIALIAGGGGDFSDNIPGRFADAGNVTGLGVSLNGEILYFIDAGGLTVRAVNISTGPRTIAGSTVLMGYVTTFASTGFSADLNGLAINPLNGDVYVADATTGANKVFRIAANTLSPTAAPLKIAGTGAFTKADDAFLPGQATGIPLLQPRAIVFDPSGNLYIADTGHARVIKVDPVNNASLIAQFAPKSSPGTLPYGLNPYTTGLAYYNGKLYIANGNTQDVARIDSPGGSNSTTIAGKVGIACDYTSTICGDGGPAVQSSFTLNGSTSSPPLAGLAADGNGLYVLDQGNFQRGRIRYINLSLAKVELSGIVIDSQNIDTIVGSGSNDPFDGGVATSASIRSPLGVALDPIGNMWITDTLSGKLRYVNRGLASIKVFPGTPAEQEVAPGTIITVNKDVGTGNINDVTVNQAGFDTPQGLAVTNEGVFIADSRIGPSTQGGDPRRTGLIRFINTTSHPVSLFQNGSNPIDVPVGYITKIAGGSKNPDPTDVGDGANPLNAKFVGPADIAIAPNGDIYVADAGNRLVRKISRSTGIVTSLKLASSNPNEYTGIAFDSAGRLLVANAGNKQILREKSPGSGSALDGFDIVFSGDPLTRPRDVVEGKDGALYVTNAGEASPLNAGDHKIIRIVVGNNSSTATIIAGSKTAGYYGDGGPALDSLINITPQPINVGALANPLYVRTTVNIILGLYGEIIFTDTVNNAVRRIR